MRVNESDRLAAITGGGTVIAQAASKAVAASRARFAVSSVWAAAAASQQTYGATAEIIDADEEPSHGALVSSEITVL
ncbi:hypothetical protein MSAS_24540 [Mycobacterium saskatchewanense]|uniref:Uncharacterized protein n=1 Tax=Mycobacterium saskatchewanense TaxID=220927 RepID=A0AAJ3NQY7_9MYCO|nr:hypothetical protein AWC23_14460 [Mycobacterium saskatchewanense]BBX63280.1 hypothetical protein MSAS_24540 [Mycobacterium saskatchewanense]